MTYSFRGNNDEVKVVSDKEMGNQTIELKKSLKEGFSGINNSSAKISSRDNPFLESVSHKSEEKLKPSVKLPDVIGKEEHQKMLSSSDRVQIKKRSMRESVKLLGLSSGVQEHSQSEVQCTSIDVAKPLALISTDNEAVRLSKTEEINKTHKKPEKISNEGDLTLYNSPKGSIGCCENKRTGLKTISCQCCIV